MNTHTADAQCSAPNPMSNMALSRLGELASLLTPVVTSPSVRVSGQQLADQQYQWPRIPDVRSARLLADRSSG